ncbi:hypothetical protein [Candidatus Marithrix sp. Canyon 246]|uniref:hypothetical protein n=1 Tax=Candidatus Marithrix sp. Canyon 246 TaxID=1827136 RepID=UPI00084A0679|nr:hypothetical protein [Candidatus Marithrix sp. Canyon 246]
MATETVLANAVTHPITTVGGATKAFLIAHPVGVAVVGASLIGAGTYWAMKKFMGEKEESVAAETA